MSRSRLVARNVITTLGTQLISWGLTFVVTFYLPRYVGDTGLGTLTLAGSYAAILALLVSLGTSTVLVKEIALARDRVGELVLGALALRLPLGILAVLLAWAITWLLRGSYDWELRSVILVAVSVMVLITLNDVLGCALRGLEEIPRQNAAGIVEKIISSVLTILLVLHRAPLWTLIAVAAVSTSVSFCINASAFIPYWKTIHRPSRETLRMLVIGGMPYLATAVFVAVYGQSDAILMKTLSTKAAIGWYGLAKRLGGATMLIPVAFATAMLPTLSRVYQEDNEKFAGAVRRLFNFMLVFVVPFAAILILAPGQIIRVLHYPDSFKNSIPVLMIMGAAVILWFLSQAVVTVLIACNRQAVLSRVASVAALISVPLCAGCIYASQHWMHNGAVGAMASDVLVEAYLVVGYIRALPAGLFSSKNFWVLGRAMAAALPIVGAFYFVHNKLGMLMVVPGLLLYVPLCFVLGCLHPQDLQMIRQILTKKSRA